MKSLLGFSMALDHTDNQQIGLRHFSIFSWGRFPMTYFSHLHENNFPMTFFFFKLRPKLHKHVYFYKKIGKCSHVIFELRRLCHLILIHSTFLRTKFRGQMPTAHQMTSLKICEAGRLLSPTSSV